MYKTRYIEKVLLLVLLILPFSGLPALSGNPVDWQNKLAKGYQDLSLGNVDQALKFFSHEVKDHPDSAACHTALGIALKKKGKVDEARNEFSQATQVEPSYADAYYQLGSVQEVDQHWAEAVLAFEKYMTYGTDKRMKDVVSERIRSCKEHIQN